MKVVAVYSLKGGVGKTACAVNLAWSAAAEGKKVLLWDLDPQGASSYYFRVKNHLKGSFKHLLKAKTKLANNIKATDYPGLDLLPADFSLRQMDQVLEETKQPRKQLRRALEPFLDEYDLILLDCPPNLTLLSENILRAADVVLCPVVPTPLSQRTLAQLQDFMVEEGCKAELWPFFSMVEGRKNLHRDLMLSLPASNGPFLPIAIPYLSDVERMGLTREPVGISHPGCAATKSFKDLYHLLASRMGISPT